ncbi:MAG: GPP34 family phosphoprotein [candidate division KSB1 bacterium]|nr:GPP34 family phosphoprotein [candidate division KSB1 bacterium]
MLMLPEKLMLLALHDEKGAVVFSSSTALPFALAGGVLLELFFRKKITMADNKVRFLDAKNTGELVLDRTLRLMQESARPRDVKHWVTRIRRSMKNLKKEIIRSLVRKGILKQEVRRILWVFKLHRYPARDRVPEMEIRQHIRNVVLHGHPPTEEDVALLSLINACNLVGEVFPKNERKQAKQRLKELTRDEAIGKAVSAAVAEMTAAVSAAVAVNMAVTAGAGSR